MPCERYRDALTDAAAGGAVGAPLEAHLTACPACASELASLRRLMAAADDELSALAAAEASPGLRVRIREAVAEPSAIAPAFRWSFAWTATAAAVLALAVLGVWRMSVARGPALPTVAVNGPSAPASTPPSVEPAADAAPSSVAVVGVPASAEPAAARFPSESTHKATSVREAAVVRRSARTEPEVLVPAGEQEALLHYVALVHQNKAEPTALLAVGRPSLALSQQDLVIAPVEIAPLDPAEAQGS